MSFKIGTCLYDSGAGAWIKYGLNYVSPTTVALTTGVYPTEGCTDPWTDVTTTVSQKLFEGNACNGGFKLTLGGGMNMPSASGMLFTAYTNNDAGQAACAVLDKGKLNPTELDFWYLVYSTTCDSHSPIGAASTNGYKYVCQSGSKFTYNDYASATCGDAATPTADNVAAYSCTASGDFGAFADVFTDLAGTTTTPSGVYRVDCWNGGKKVVKVAVPKGPKGPKRV